MCPFNSPGSHNNNFANDDVLVFQKLPHQVDHLFGRESAIAKSNAVDNIYFADSPAAEGSTSFNDMEVSRNAPCTRSSLAYRVVEKPIDQRTLATPVGPITTMLYASLSVTSRHGFDCCKRQWAAGAAGLLWLG